MITIPRDIPVMALPGAVLFPHSLLPLHIFEQRYRDMLSKTLDGDRMFAVALLKRGVSEAVKVTDVCGVAGVGLIRACVGSEDGTSNLVLQGLARVRLVEWTQVEPYRIAQVELVESRISNAIEADALSAKVKELCAGIEKAGVPLPGNLMEHLQRVEDPEVLADAIAAAFVGEASQRQQLLEAQDVSERLRLLIQILRSHTPEQSE